MSEFKALQTRETSDGRFISEIVSRRRDELPPGEVLVRVHYSSLNYKDALSASGHRGVTRSYPHTPGIDAAGIVESSTDSRFSKGQEVIVTGYDLGMNTAGGFGQCIRVPADWVVAKPDGLPLKESMMLGTAGLTAALCVDKLLRMGLGAAPNGVLVTGATGGVGSVAVVLLKKLGFKVIASTGKLDQTAFLHSLGADEVLDRNNLPLTDARPLLGGRWDAAVDTVGGSTLATILRSMHFGGSVACCGMVESAELHTNVFPFILRNINLLGVASAETPLRHKQDMWSKLAGEWHLSLLPSLCHEITLDEVPEHLERLLAGQGIGRTVVNLQE